jgi:hypothetical protein
MWKCNRPKEIMFLTLPHDPRRGRSTTSAGPRPPGKGGAAATEEAHTSSSSSRRPLLSRWQRRQQPVGEYTIHVLVLMVVDEGGWRRQRWRSAADNSVDGSGRQAGSLLSHYHWWRQSNCRRTMDNCWLKVGRRQNYLLTKL